MPSEFLLCSSAQHLYTLTLKHQASYYTTAGVQTGYLLGYTCQQMLSPYSIPPFLNVTVLPLQCLYRGCIQSKQQLALSQIMHNIHCGSAIFSYQTLQRRPSQETLIDCEELHNIKNSKALNIQFS
jgi:hypothetical protein